MRVSPCKGCEEREVGCHTHCTGYKKWKGENDAERKYQRDAIDGLVREISQYTSMTKPKKGGGRTVEYG